LEVITSFWSLSGCTKTLWGCWKKKSM